MPKTYAMVVIFGENGVSSLRELLLMLFFISFFNNKICQVWRDDHRLLPFYFKYIIQGT